ncbi:MAG: hypothetical protein DMD87_17210 [Candidatus Rokuibacteriota bacterium]|nr:MAG: hypothetical protein DMD87_17210 [Candidatus Rokubacteria bacterium]
MTYILNSAKTMRNLRVYAGAFNQGPYVSMVQDSRVLTFTDVNGAPQNVDMKPGSTFYHDGMGLLATVQGGAGSSYLLDQPAPSTGGSYQNWYSTDKTTAKGRNSSGVQGSDIVIAGMLVPDAVHYIYLSLVDDAGNPDYYAYVDTIQPERGVHPYTRDLSIGSFKTVPRTLDLNKTTGRPIMDINTRVRNLEGVVRAGRAAGSSVQDDRLAKLVARLVAFETWANSGGHFGSPPAVGSSTVYTEDQFIQAGDQA